MDTFRGVGRARVSGATDGPVSPEGPRRARAGVPRYLSSARRGGGWRYALLLVAVLLLGVSDPVFGAQPEAPDSSLPDTGEVTLWYFWGDGCPVCDLASAWLDDLRDDRPDLLVREIEVWDDRDGQALFLDMMRERGKQASAVPAFILEDEVWVGFSDVVAADIERAVEERLDAADHPNALPEARDPGARTTIDLGPLGAMNVAEQPMAAATVLIAFVDGFNPCSLWVLTVLLAMILHTRSRARIAAVGGVFLLVTASLYGLFIAGLYAAFTVAAHLGWIRVVVALFAFGFAAVSIKDYFAYQQGLSFSIPERFKPRIYRGGRQVRRTDRPLPVVLGLTVVFAAGIALIELPCTAGFPVVWTSLLSEAGVAGAAFLGLLATYLLVYLAVEIAIVIAALATMRATRLQEVHGRTLKLLGGTVMAAVAVVLLVAPTVMERLSGSLLVVGGALAAAALVIALDRLRLHRAGT